MAKNIALILSGCGYLDGAEIRESVLSLLELSRQGANVKIFAPTEDAFHTVDHLKSQPQGEGRNMLTEAARIARGQISPISELKAQNFDALVIPGGFGVAKNFCTFAFDGPAARVLSSVQNVIESFYALKKPIAAICIAPALVALVLKNKNIRLTIGSDEATAQALTQLGANHQNCEVDQIVVDETNKIVSTPAYMYDDAPLAKIANGIAKCIEKVIALA